MSHPLPQIMHSMFAKAMIEGHSQTGINTNLLIPLFVEFIVYQMFLLAPMEVEEWVKTIPDQCKSPTAPIKEMTINREDLVLTLEMNTNVH